MKIIGEDDSPFARAAYEEKWARQYTEVATIVRKKYASRMLCASKAAKLWLMLLQEAETRLKVWWNLCHRL